MRTDPALVALSSLPGAAALLISAMGGEKFTVITYAFPLTAVIVFLGWVILARNGPVSRAIVAPVLSLVIVISTAITHWPLRLSFAASRPTFEKLVERLLAGDRVDPRQIGLFRVRSTQIYTSKDIVCLWTDMDSKGRKGFVRCRPSEVPFNLFSLITVDDDWQFISED